MTPLLIILLFLIVYLIFSVTQFYNVLFRGYAPFVSTDSGTIRRIISEVRIKEQAIIYELGCGQATFLKMAERLFPRARLIGIENLFTLYFINLICLKLKRSKIRLLKQDFFNINLQDADLVYCYLNNATMAKLGEKFRQECQDGTIIISRSFPIPKFMPEKIIEIKNKKIYFYKI